MAGFFNRKPFDPYGLPDYMTSGGGINGMDPQVRAAQGLPPTMGGQGIDYSLPEDPYEGERLAEPGFFGKGGGGGGVLGWARDILAFGPMAPIARMQRKRQDEEDQANNAYKIAMAQKATRDQTGDTPAMREAMAMGHQPGSPEFASYVRRARMKPSFMMMGNPEMGQQIVDPEAMAGFGGGGQPIAKQLPDGRTAYWVNGEWYDNPEGR